jgi:hypothetical protein
MTYQLPHRGLPQMTANVHIKPAKSGSSFGKIKATKEKLQ